MKPNKVHLEMIGRDHYLKGFFTHEQAIALVNFFGECEKGMPAMPAMTAKTHEHESKTEPKDGEAT